MLLCNSVEISNNSHLNEYQIISHLKVKHLRNVLPKIFEHVVITGCQWNIFSFALFILFFLEGGQLSGGLLPE